MNVRALCICFVLLLSVVASAATKGDSAAVAVAERMARTIVEESAGVESLSAVLYVRERVEVEKKNLLLNLFPDMTRFDKGKDCYLAEPKGSCALRQQVAHSIINSLPAKAVLLLLLCL